MIIKTKDHQINYGELLLNGKIHLIIPASKSLGFDMTSAYLKFNCKMPSSQIQNFKNQVNQKKEVGSLYPKFKLSMFPVNFNEPEQTEKIFEDLFELEMKYIKSNNIVIDLFASSFENEVISDFVVSLENYLGKKQNQYIGKIEVRTNI